MRRYHSIVMTVCLLGGLAFSQYFYDQAKAKSFPTEPLVLNEKVVKLIDFGLHNTASDIYWLSGIQYFGGRSTSNAKKLPEYLSTAMDLDPKFAYPYAFGALVLPAINEVEKGIGLAKKGIENVSDWRIPYYLATTYHIDKKDSKNAAFYFNQAANTKGAPENIKKVAARYGSSTDSREQIKQIWTGIYENSKDDVVKEQAKNYLTHYEIMDFLEEAANIYKKKFGDFPSTPSQMIPTVIKNVPDDPLGFQFKFDPKGKVTF